MTTHPTSYYWSLVKDMNDSQKLELVSIIIDSIRHSTVSPQSMKRYTMDDIDAMIAQAESEIKVGKGTPHEELMREWDEEIEQWEQEDRKLEVEIL
ncbi:MAG: hypothetical protein IJ150_07235 [Bacteroidales bacterium]|nr:hypothetical protein [Bacteroidales bacterium]